jgi:hypothetical protein
MLFILGDLVALGKLHLRLVKVLLLSWIKVPLPVS